MMRTVLVLGATSPIARGAAEAFARRGHDLCLAARDADELAAIAADLRVRTGRTVETRTLEAGDPESFGPLVDGVEDLYGAVLALGYMGDADRARTDADHAQDIIEVNLGASVGLLTHVARRLESRGEGFIVGVSSVAGDRGRQSNYVYGAAKGGLNVFLSGLRNRLAPAGVHVVTAKPGFVDTKMTFGLDGLFLVADPADVGEGLARAVDRGRNEVYLPFFWRGIMGVIRAIPEGLFKRLKL